jgi:hypothetical protein
MRNGGLIGGLASVELHGDQMRNGGRASRKRRNEDGQYTTERLEGDNAQYAIGLGLGVHTKPKPKPRKPRGQYKPRYDPIEFGREMDVKISEFFEVGKRLPGRRQMRKALLADSMGLSKKSKKFCTAWDQLKDHEFRLAK